MSHLKRQSAPRSWPIERKGTTYIVKSNFNVKEGIPVLVVLRDILKLAENRTEVKRIIHSKQILVNEKNVKDEKNTILLFDTVNIIPIKKCYRMELSDKGKFYLKEIKENEAGKKISKITNKKTLNGKKIQLNLSDGRNFLSDIKCNINDSVVINLKGNKIEKCLPLKEKAKIIIFAGKHIGSEGEVQKLNMEEKTAKVKVEGKEINILINQLMVVE
jgi:small subunit ribosomal protein S4e